MRQVSVLFINMVLPAKGSSHSWALQKAFEVIHESARRLRGKGLQRRYLDNGTLTFLKKKRSIFGGKLVYE